MKYIKKIISATLLTGIIPTLNSKAKTTQEGSIQKTRELSEYIISISIPMSKKDAETIIKASKIPLLQDFDIANKCLNEVKKLIQISSYKISSIYYNKNKLIIEYKFLSTAKPIEVKTDEKLKRILEQHMKLWIESVKTKTHVIEITIPMPELEVKITTLSHRLLIERPSFSFQQQTQKAYISARDKIKKICPILDVHLSIYMKNGLIMHTLFITPEKITSQQEAQIKPILTEYLNTLLKIIKSNTKVINNTMNISEQVSLKIKEKNKDNIIKAIQPIIGEVIKKILDMFKIRNINFEVTPTKNGLKTYTILVTTQTLTYRQEMQIQKMLQDCIEKCLTMIVK